MRDVVSQALTLRADGDGAFWPMLGISTVGHALVLGALVLVPGILGGQAVSDEPRVVMSISLGGAPGPRAGGMTPMGGRPIQSVTETPTARPQPVRPPAAKPPDMTMPTRDARPAPRREQLRSAPAEARGTTPTRGPREQLGSAIAETGGQGLGLGLSTGGGGGTGGEINLGDFCCPEYLSTMLQLIQRNWQEKQAVGGHATMRFTIRRDGSIVDVEVARSSGYTALDLAAQRALLLTRLPPLPAAYTNAELTINLNFQYQR
jgi:TonB family protein